MERLKRQVYAYDPHLPPVLRFDQHGKADALPELLQIARTRALTADEARVLADGLRKHEPWLEWTGKREKKQVEVDPVALHIHERVSTRAILSAVQRQTPQRGLFADPAQSYREAIQFYQHEVGWSNRLILGDSLAVMASLAVRENLAGKVQMIYIDPPYGIKFASNFQPVVGKRDVKEKSEDLSREPEVVKAYRDTWELGVHTYLTYLRDRLRVSRDLLAETGSIFVQISDENVHRVRQLLDDIFGPTNFCAQVVFRKTTGKGGQRLDNTYDTLLWYARDKTNVTFHPIFESRTIEDDENLRFVELRSGARRKMYPKEAGGDVSLPEGSRAYRPNPITNQRPAQGNDLRELLFEGFLYKPGAGTFRTDEGGMRRLAGAGRLLGLGNTLTFVRYLDDFAYKPRNDIWDDTRQSGFGDAKVYVVQTGTKVVERCLLMTTSPGDLVLDPTGGSGTTAVVAEKWGRRWISIDSSRVAMFVARQRLLTATYDYFRLKNPGKGVAGGFINKSVGHVTLGSIAQNKALDTIFAKHAPLLTSLLGTLNAALVKVTHAIRAKLQDKLNDKRRRKDPDDPVTDADERRWLLPRNAWQEWEVPYDTDPDWPQALLDALLAYRKAWRTKMDEVNACIARNAEQEELVDQPEVDRKIMRVSGPFTVEGVEPAAEDLDAPSPIEAPEGELPLFVGEPAVAYGAQADNADVYTEKMLRMLKSDGVRFMNNRTSRIDRLDRRAGGVLHGEGEWAAPDAEPRKLAVVIGPQFGPVTAKLVEQAVRAAARGGFDDLVVAGFSFDAEATGLLDDDPDPDVRTHLAHIRPDVQMEDLLKDSPNSQIFTVFGSPRTRLEAVGDGEYTVDMEGMDVYDPVNNAIQPTGADKVAAWFLDADYDGRTFCISQAFFPDRSAWDKIARALKGSVEEGAFERFSGKRSQPFRPGPHRRVAIKVIDPRGNEVMRVHTLPDGR